MDMRNNLLEIRNDGKKVLVVGLGISGVETARFLLSCGISVVAAERDAQEKVSSGSKFWPHLCDLRARGVEMHFGVDGEGVLALVDGVALAVVSPGISLESAVCGALSRRAVPLLSELELGIELRQVPALVITGSNGKSTTVSLIHHLLQSGGVTSRLCGNVGTPVVAGLDATALDSEHRDEGVLVVEASSYQIESCHALKPKAAVLLNLSENHLERHGTLERYFEIKSRVFSLQDGADWAILNRDDAFAARLIGRTKGKVLQFGLIFSGALATSGAWIEYNHTLGIDRIIVSYDGKSDEYKLADCRLIGLHNRYDIAAAILAVLTLGVSTEKIRAGLRTFMPLTHRLEFSRSGAHATFVNDSKSTTVAASVAAFNSIKERFPERKIVLLIGGLSKAGSWDPLMKDLDSAPGQLRGIVCFGKDGALLAGHCRAHGLACGIAPTLEAAVAQAHGTAQEGDIVLLSPGCASFDEFQDFEDRGQVFKSLVAKHVPGIW